MQKERGEGFEPTFAPLVPSTLAVIAALELTPLPQTIRELSFYPRRLRGEKSNNKSGHKSGQDRDESLIASVHVMPVLRSAGLRAFNVSEQGA